jgi:hypothetical protein
VNFTCLLYDIALHIIIVVVVDDDGVGDGFISQAVMNVSQTSIISADRSVHYITFLPFDIS